LNKKFIPVCEPFLDGNEKKYVMAALDSGWISSSGRYVLEFEKAFSEYCGIKHGITASSGTAALHLSLLALGISNNDEVIIPNFTMIASAFAVSYVGAKPVFIDAEKESWNIDPSKIEQKITSNTKAIMPVHIFGVPCNMDLISEIADNYGLKVMEDAAESHGAKYKGNMCGSLSDISGFSFFANKIVSIGEGGMVLTNDDELADKCRYYRNLCFPIDKPRDYQHDEIGYNYRLSNLSAAIGLAQVEKIQDYVDLRVKNNSLYRTYLEEVDGITHQITDALSESSFWMNGIVIDEKRFGKSRDVLVEELKKRGIESRVFFSGMHTQKSLAKYDNYDSDDYPVSQWLSINGLYLPSASNLKEETISYICDSIKQISISK